MKQADLGLDLSAKRTRKREFAQLPGGVARLPDETTILRFSPRSGRTRLCYLDSA